MAMNLNSNLNSNFSETVLKLRLNLSKALLEFHSNLNYFSTYIAMTSHGIFDDFEAEITGDKINGPFKAVGHYRSWIGQYHQGKKVGKWTYHNNVKNIIKTMYYANDKLEGLFELLSPSKIVRANYENGVMHGVYVKHNFKNGTSITGHYRYGYKFGSWIKKDVMNDGTIYHINYRLSTDQTIESVFHGFYMDELYQGTYDNGVKVGTWLKRDRTEIISHTGTGISNHTIKLRKTTLFQKLGGICHGFYISDPLTEEQHVSYYHFGQLKKAPSHMDIVLKNHKYQLTFINESGNDETIEFLEL